MKKSVLFLCTHNSCRSQMAEALLREYAGDTIDVFSAGTKATEVNPGAAAVLKELDIDTEKLSSKTIDELPERIFDLVVTVCDNAKEHCPLPPKSAEVKHQPFPDPPELAAKTETEEEKLQCFRDVRDQINQFVKNISIA